MRFDVDKVFGFECYPGYSQHQGSYLLLKKSGEVIARDRVGQDSLQKGLQTLSGRKRSVSKGKGPRTFKEGALGICRDISGELLEPFRCSIEVLFCDTGIMNSLPVSVIIIL